MTVGAYLNMETVGAYIEVKVGAYIYINELLESDNTVVIVGAYIYGVTAGKDIDVMTAWADNNVVRAGGLQQWDDSWGILYINGVAARANINKVTARGIRGVIRKNVQAKIT
jgi:hypothetical protein